MNKQQFNVGSVGVSFVRGDITTEATDAIVNAANSSLLGGGGVDGAIHAAAGPRLLEACRALRPTLPPGGLPPGGAVITPGFDLRAANVIHCVGPRYTADPAAAPHVLARCYTEAVALCRSHGLRSIAFPSISTGAFGYPVDEAASVAIRAVRDALESPGPLRWVKWVLFDDATLRAYLDAARAILG